MPYGWKILFVSQAKVVFYREPINIRLSAERLADFVKWSDTTLDSGDIFIFFNRKRDHCKIIWHDGEGYCTVEKRLMEGTFASSDKIAITQATVDRCLSGEFTGQTEILHALMGNIVYLRPGRKF